jgi:sigma-E factor negative regulatory protein RseC
MVWLVSRTIWQVATVVEVSDDRIRLAFDPLSACARCLNGEGCGSGVFARLFSRRQTLMALGRQNDFRIGQKLRVGVEASHLVYGALFLYGIPVVAFVFGAVLASLVIGAGPGGDLAALVAGLVLAGVSVTLFRQRTLSGLNPRLEPLSCTSSGCGA